MIDRLSVSSQLAERATGDAYARLIELVSKQPDTPFLPAVSAVESYFSILFLIIVRARLLE